MIIVSGLPRSGTSLMMEILIVNGVGVLEDGERKPDIHNPRGYYEMKNIGERIKSDSAFLKNKKGCVKILAPFVDKVEGDHEIIFMERNLDEISASMKKMSGKEVSSKEREVFEKYLRNVKERFKCKGIVYINYNNLIKNPKEELAKLKEFLPFIDVGKSIEQIDNGLYRNRS